MKKKTYLVKAPAKINLGLRILAKREDAFHDLETIFLPINLYDMIKLNIIEDVEKNISVKMSSKPMIDSKDNICFRATESFLNEYKIPEKYSIYIDIKKKIPIGSGLGGGSSDAASVLMILGRHFLSPDIKQDFSIMKEIALSLGSDVPFFLLNKPAYAESRGENFNIIRLNAEDIKILAVNPHIHISTSWAFKEFDYRQSKKSNKENNDEKKNTDSLFDVLNNIKSKIRLLDFLEANRTFFQNDFEEVIFKRFYRIKSIKRELYKFGAVFASMSGSGSTVYGFFSKKNNSSAKKAKEFFKSKGYAVYTTYIVNA